MQKQLKENNNLKKSYCKVNEYISIQKSENELKIIIYIKNEPIITIPSLKFPFLEYTLQEINDNLVHHKLNFKNNKIETIFRKLALILENWSNSNYDTHLLNYKIAFPLLKKLREVGETRFQIIFQQEILKRYSTSPIEVKNFLEQEGYLNLIGDFF